LDTFPIVRTHDVSVFGEYRTKSMTLKEYDRLATLARASIVGAAPCPSA